jgi:2-polyprenyl-3-methyl-5-hydroxy-6-metoxy-1,4-benzoquinol methylase
LALVYAHERNNGYAVIGSELAPYAEYLLNRGTRELRLSPRLSAFQRRLAPLFVSAMGIPEIGVQLRIMHVLRELPRDCAQIVDAGCGAGMLLGAVHVKFPHVRLSGIDVDSESCNIAAEAHPYAEIHNDDVVQGAVKLEARYDCAVCVDVLEHVEDSELDTFTGALARLLRRGGHLILHTPAAGQRRHLSRFKQWSHHGHAREGFTPEDLRALLHRSGLELVRLRGTFGYFASFAWELNMAIAATPIQAAFFLPLLALAALGGRAPGGRYNGMLCVARRS